MSVFAIIGAVLRLLTLWFSQKMERDAARKKELEAASKEINEGIKNRDASAVNRAIGRLRRA